ncbi:unnamed protein product [Rhizophagus irregularis]|nr:unnamed protein product [Rhizophagus irregularis]
MHDQKRQNDNTFIGLNREVRKKVANKRKIGREYEFRIIREDVELNIEIDEEFRNEERDNERVNNYSKLGDFGRKIHIIGLIKNPPQSDLLENTVIWEVLKTVEQNK